MANANDVTLNALSSSAISAETVFINGKPIDEYIAEKSTGTKVYVEQITTEGTLIAKISCDSDIKEIYTPKAEKEYTAFEVFPTSADITAGTIDDVTLCAYTNDVPAQMTFKIIVRSDGTGAWDGFTMDWGDGQLSTISNAEVVSGNKATMSHTYSEQGRYIVKVYGNIFGFGKVDNNGTYNLISRIWDSDLPIASGCYSWKETLRGNKRLLKVQIPYTFKWPRANMGLYYTFYDCKNLISFKSEATTPFCQSMQCMFSNCTSLKCCEMEYEGYGIWKSVDGRYSTMFSGCTNLETPVYKIIPMRGWMCQQIHVEEMFNNCSSLPANIGDGNAGTSIASVLWNLESHGYQFWHGNTSQGKNVFSGCSDALRALIPTTWGGTKSI